MTGVNAAGQYVERCVPIVIALYIRTVPIHTAMCECIYVCHELFVYAIGLTRRLVYAEGKGQGTHTINMRRGP